MNFIETLEKTFLDGFAQSEITAYVLFACIITTAVISLYIYYLYKLINRNSFYNKNFNMSLIALSIITAAIILTIQSNIVVSLGMVGALSIVRFRTAIKDPMDLVFLFWAISIGIICGAGYALIALFASLVLTIIIVILTILPTDKPSKLLVVDASSISKEEKIIEIVSKHSRQYRVRARTACANSLNLAIEIKTHRESEILEELLRTESYTNNFGKVVQTEPLVIQASIVEHDGDITV